MYLSRHVAMPFRKSFPLIAALWLQVAPMLVRLEPVTAALARPLAVLLRWMAGGTAVSGAFHAVSGATGLTVTGPTGLIPNGQPIVANRGAAYSGVTFKINSSEYGIPKAYTFLNLPPGLRKSGTATIQGIPTKSGNFSTQVIGWEKANASGHSAPFDVKFVIQGSPPVITVQPVTQTVNAGAEVTFSVTVTGEAPLTYQWFWEDLEIAGTQSTLLLSGVRSDQGGGYRVRVNSPGGTTFSDFARLSVVSLVKPAITQQPSGQTVDVGADVVLTVAASGSDPLKYVWLKGGVEIGGTATNATLRLSSVGVSDTGEYQVRITNAAGGILSEIAQVNVQVPIMPPSIVSQSSGVTAYLGDRVRLVVTVTPSSPAAAPVVTWWKGGKEVAGVVGPELILSSLSAADEGDYVARLQGTGGTVFSAPMTVRAVPLPALALTPGPAGLVIAFPAIAGREYVLEAQDGLGSPWSGRQTLRPTTGTAEAIAPMDAAMGFYRIRATPLP